MELGGGTEVMVGLVHRGSCVVTAQMPLCYTQPSEGQVRECIPGHSLGVKSLVEVAFAQRQGWGQSSAFSCTGQVASSWTRASSQGVWTGRLYRRKETAIPPQTHTGKAL